MALTRTRKTLFVLISILLLTGGAELVTRLVSWSVLLSRRSAGGSSAQKVLACYGDSWTFGLGVSEDAAYPAALRRAMPAAGLGHWQVLNRGVPGFGVEKTAARITDDFNGGMRADLILLLVGMNDVATAARVAGHETVPAQRTAVLQHSAAYRVLKSLVLSVRQRYAPSWESAAPNMPSDAFEDRLKSLLAAVARQKTRAVVLNYPLPVDPKAPQLLIRGDLDLLSAAQRRAAQSRNVPWVDLQPLFDQMPGDGPWLNNYLTHPNDLGYAMMAASLLSIVAQQVGQPTGMKADPRNLLPLDRRQEARAAPGEAPAGRNNNYTRTTDAQGREVIVADTNGDGTVDYRAYYAGDALERLTRNINLDGKPVTEDKAYQDGQLVSTSVTDARGVITRTWARWMDPLTLVEMRYSDTNGDSRYEIYEERINGALRRHLEDGDADGQWETQARIDKAGQDQQHTGDLDGDGKTDYWAHWSVVDGEKAWVEIAYGDKNKDGIWDHYEERHNEVLFRLQDDNDQDGRWEVWARIDEAGRDYAHLGDLNGDGRVDYWENREPGLPPVQTVYVDPNGDGRWEIYEARENGVLRRHLEDNNGDGRWEVVGQVDRDGNLVRLAGDLDGDGRPDYFTSWVVENGKKIKVETSFTDKNRDGKWDHFEERRNGVVVKRQDDTDGDGRWDTWVAIDANGQDTARLGDRNGDGRVDYWEKLGPGDAQSIYIDGDGDGKWDIHEEHGNGALLLHEEDHNRDGRWEVRARIDGQGRIVGLDGDLDGDGRDDYYAHWITENGKTTKVEIAYADKNRDGVWDHLEERRDETLFKLQDDNNQDGRWEVWALIDEAGNDYMHLGDIDGDGRVDYWEVRDRGKTLFQSSDKNHDGRPDDPLPPWEQLGLIKPIPDVLKYWK